MCDVKSLHSWLSLSALSFSRENQGSSGPGKGFGEVLCEKDFASSTHSHPKQIYINKTSKHLPTGSNVWNRHAETQGWMENYGMLGYNKCGNPGMSFPGQLLLAW